MNIFKDKLKLNIVKLIVFAMLLQLAVPITTNFSFAEEDPAVVEEANDGAGVEEELPTEDVEQTTSSADEGTSDGKSGEVEPESEPGTEEIGEVELPAVDEEQTPPEEEEQPNALTNNEVGVTAVDREPMDLGNIFSNPKITINDIPVKDGTEINSEDFRKLKIEYDWELPNDGVDFKLFEGDFAAIKLPEVIKALNPNQKGNLLDKNDEIVGEYIFLDGDLKAEFNNMLVGKEDRKGKVWFLAEFDLRKFEENVIQEIDFGEEFDPITIRVEPTKKLASVDKRVKLNADINATEIYWEIDVNRTLDSLTNATIEDKIPEGLELVADSIKIYDLEVGYNGKITVGIEDKHFDTESIKSEFKVNFGKIDTAYRIKYTTTIKDHTKTPFTNDAVLKDNDTEKAKGSASVSKINRGSSIEKFGEAYKGDTKNDVNSTKITWTIDVNKSEAHIKNAIVSDNITDPRLKINVGSIKVNYLDNTGSGWEVGDKAEGISLTNNTGFPIILGDTQGRAYRIVFDTDIDYGNTYEEQNAFENTVILSGEGLDDEPAEAKAVIVSREKLLTKDGKETTNYNDPHITWTIHVNKAEQKLTSAVLTDEIPDGLKLIENSIEVLEEGKTPFTPKSITKETNKLQIEFGNIEKYYTVKYVTKIDDDLKAPFTNKVTLESKGLGGSGIGEGGITVEKEVPLTVKNSYTKSRIYGKVIDGKNYNGIDYANKTLSWNIKIDAKKEAIKDLKIVDKFTNNGLKFLEGTLIVRKKVGATEETIMNYTVTPTNEGQDGFVIIFGELEKAEYNIYFKTSFDPDEVDAKNLVNNYINHAYFTGNTIGLDGKTKEIIIDNPASYNLDKQAYESGKKEGKLDRKNKAITWEIYVNYLSQDLKGPDFIIEDILGESEQELNFDSIKVYKYTVKANGNTDIDSESIDQESYKLEVKNENNKSGFKLTFEGGIDEPYVIRFTTKIKGVAKERYTNEAKVTSGDITQTYKATTGQYENYDKFIEKGATNVSGDEVYTDDTINWAVTINRSSSEINKAVFKDTISKGLVYVYNTLEVLDDEGNYLVEAKEGEEIGNGKYKLTIDDDREDETIVITVELGDIDSQYTIKYDTVVIAKDGHVSNQASIEGKDFEIKTVEKVEFSSTQASGGTGGGVNRGSITVKKVDSDNTDNIINAVFKLYYMLNGKEQVVGDGNITTIDGEYRFEALALNNSPYYLKEVEAPEGYVGLTEPIEINLPDAKGNKEIKIKVENTKIRRDIEFVKYGEDNDTLKGAEFTLYRISEDDEIEISKVTTEADGKVVFKGVEYGEYLIKETKAPDGFLLSDVKLEVSITENGVAIDPTDGKGVSNTKIRGNINFTKYGEEENPLSGAEFTLYDENDNVIKTVKSNKNGEVEFTNIEYGDYYIKETEAPEGYNKTDKVLMISIREEGKTVTPEYESNTIIDGISNTKIRGSLEILKVERRTTKPLKGAEFTLYHNDGTEVERKTTDEDGIVNFENLVYGDYYFIETKAPSGYRQNKEKIEFSIVDNNVVVKLEVENTIIPDDPYDPEGRIRIIKKDSDTRELLSGAKFELIDSKGNVVETLTTNSRGEATSRRLPIGWYTIEETNAPKGYILEAEVIEQKITDGVTSEVVIFNEKEEDPEKPVEPIKPTDPEKPTEPGKPTEPDKPVGPGDEFENVDDKNPEGTGKPEENKPTLPKTGYTIEIGILMLGFVLLTIGLILKIKENN